MTDSGVLERRLRPIHDAVSAGNYRQALKECEKWQKKGEKSDKFLALKAYVLVHQQDLNQVEKGETETIDLCHRSPPVTDLDAIQTIQGALEELSLEDEGEALFERAAAAKPGDRALLMTWLNDCLADARWQSAQKATMALRKAFPNDREYDFWNMLLCFLVHKDPAVEEKQRAMFGTLAYRMINKAAPNTAADQTANANKIVSTPEELALLAQIYIATGHAAEATTLLSELLDTETTNAGSQDPQLVLSLFIDAITASADWDQAVKQCEKMLQTSEHQNDDRIWTLVLQAHAKGEDAIKQKAGDLLKKFTTDEKLRNRSSLLARLKSLSSSGSQDDDTEIEKLCRMYYSSHKGRSFAFQDLRSSLEGLEQDKRRQFLKHIAEENGPDTPTANQIFSQKVERLAPTSSTGESLQNAANSLSIYQQSTRKGARSPEAVLLAAFSMLEAASQSNSSQLLLRATALVQLSYGKDEAHFPSAILLISIFRQLGLLSLAIATFVSLSVKNLQFETVAHHLLTRISTLHPHRPATSHADADTEEPETIMEPANAVDTALAVNDKVADGLAESIRRGFREGSYSNILDSVDTRTSIQTSIGRRIFQIEDRKLARLTGADATTHNGAYGLGLPPPQPSDMRDFAFLPSYSKQDDRLWEELSSGPTPQRHWLNVMTLVENIRAYLRSGAEDGQGTSPWTQVVIAYKEALETSKEGKEELTLRELWTYDLALQVFSIAGCGAVGEDSPGVADESGDPSENILKLLNTWIDTTDASKPFGAADMAIGTHWSRLHTYFTAYEAASLVLTLLHWLEMRGKASSAAGPKAGGGKSQEKKKAKAGKTADASADDGANRAVFPPPEIMAQLRTAANELIEKVKAEARQAKQALSEGGVLCKLVDVIMGNADGEAAPPADDAQSQNEVFETAYAAFIESAGGEVAVEVVVGKWLASWEDALDGVLAVDVHRVVGVGGGGGGEEKGSSGIGAALGGLSGLVLRGKKGKKR